MGIAGRVAAAWLHSKLTPLVTIASLAVGGIAIVATPREEEPQISVPMIDVMTRLPGADPLTAPGAAASPVPVAGVCSACWACSASAARRSRSIFGLT